MSDGLKRLPPRFLADNERFRGSGIESPLSLRDYWRWSASSLMDNTARGLVAEFLVATALKGYIPDQPRVEWDAYDFMAKIDGRKVSIEVKSSAYVQSWEQRRYSNLQFNIRSTRKPDPDKPGTYSGERCRADIYVFCALVEKKTCEHVVVLNTDNWRFRVIPQERLRRLRDQKTIAWSSLERLPSGAFGYDQLRQRIVEEARRQRSSQTLTESFSDVRAAGIEERYDLELHQRGDRKAWSTEKS